MTHPSGSFRVDMEQAPSAVHELESALVQLEAIRKDAASLANVDARSNDSVSIDAAKLIGRAAAGGPGSLVAALDAGIAHLNGVIEAMNAELASYRRVDRGPADRFDAR